MVLEFDVLDYCRKLRTSQQPPYTCPVEECKKTYKSMCGLQYHLVNFRHENEIVKPTVQLPHSSKVEIKEERESPEEERAMGKPVQGAEPQGFVEIEIDGKLHKIDINEALPVVSQDSYDLLQSKKPQSHRAGGDKGKQKDTGVKLPEPRFKVVEDYRIADAPPRPAGYIRFIERSGEEAEGEVEYDLDEEDSAWLESANEERAGRGLEPVPVEAFEALMDRLERESYFRARGDTSDAVGDDDAVCCICLDGDCQNSNAILFCDMCNMAVHQDCYGVPFIPEEQWVCRRCLHSPSRPVDCVLCPETGGAFKQTDRRHWVHVVCALWIPEVRFANTVFLEPVDSIETIPAARWRLNCSLCDMKGVGACIQCSKANCYAAFHVTCARKAGLYMTMRTLKDSVDKVVYCAAHTPEGSEPRPKPPPSPVAPYTVSVPTIPPEKIREIGDLLDVRKKNVFVRRTIAYWTLKRQTRNGVPLLRSLQASHVQRREGGGGCSGDAEELRGRLEYWYRFRQDLERARLLCELVRKRERLKRDFTRASADCLQLRLVPLLCVLRNLHDALRRHDRARLFLEPVDLPDYTRLVAEPVDLSTMRTKIEDFRYNSVDDFARDFDLMIENCLTYNRGDAALTDAALDMRTKGKELIQSAEEDLAKLLVDLQLSSTASSSKKE